MRCSFCRRADSEVEKLVAGPTRILSGRVYICDRCADQAMQIMKAHSGEDRPLRKTPPLFRRILDGFSSKLDTSQHCGQVRVALRCTDSLQVDACCTAASVL